MPPLNRKIPVRKKKPWKDIKQRGMKKPGGSRNGKGRGPKGSKPRK